MRSFKSNIFLAVVLLVLAAFLFSDDECTTAVFSGQATVDGRPLLWKNRETTEEHNEVAFMTGGTYDVLALIDAGWLDAVWMGINSAGFAIENSYSGDLEGTATGENGVFMKYALQNCASVQEFEALLMSTNSTGRQTKANFGVIDASGAAAIFETGNTTYKKFSAGDPSAAANGFLVRTNFAETGVGTGGGYERYARAMSLFNERMVHSKISFDFILRKVARNLRNDRIDPYPLPYSGGQDSNPAGFIRTYYSINRCYTRSSVVFQGVRPGEDPRLSTMWVILGEPVCSIAVPLWGFLGSVPPEMNGAQTASMCGASMEKDSLCYPLLTSPEYLDTAALDNGFGGGIFSYSFPIEDWIFARSAAALSEWRQDFPDLDEARTFENMLVSQAFACFITNTPPSYSLMSPLRLSYERISNRSLSQREHIDVLSWQTNPENQNIVGYRIYTLEGQNKVFQAEVEGDVFQFYFRNVRPDRPYTYVVAAVDSQGLEGNPAVKIVEAQPEEGLLLRIQRFRLPAIGKTH